VNRDPRPMAKVIWKAFGAVSVVGGLVGLLAGAELVSGLGLVVFLFLALAVFVIWAVTMLDPQALTEEPEYQGEDRTRGQ